MKMQYIVISEVFDFLTNEADVKISNYIKREIDCFCGFSDDDSDSNYMFADLIRSRRSHKHWELIQDENGTICMQLENSSAELKPTIFRLLQSRNILHDGVINNPKVVV